MSERIRFQADANFNSRIIRGLRRRHPLIDMQTAEEADLSGVPDEEVLGRAFQSGRDLLSHDHHTLPAHFGVLLSSGQHAPGIFLLPQLLLVGEAIGWLELVWEESSAEEWRDTLTYLP